MAVIVSDSRNASYDSFLATANSFYRAEAWNLGSASQTALVLTTARTQAVTFANAGNCQGIILAIYGIHTAQVDRTVTARLQEAITVGSFNTSTERVNITAHGLANNTPIAFSSTGTLPTGITAGTIYYVINQTANDFQISTTVAGSAVGLSGTPTGTATAWADRASTALSSTDIMGALPTDGTTGGKYPMFQSFVPFDFAVPYAVDTTASKWRFHVVQSGGTAATWQLHTSNGTDMMYVTWCDTAISHTDGDVLIVKDLVYIDKSFAITGLTSTGDAVNSVAGFVCRNTNYTIDNVALLRWDESPAAAYTMTIRGDFLIGSHAGFHIKGAGWNGDIPLNPIPASTPATISFLAPTAGTKAYSEILSPSGASSSSAFSGKGSFIAYGEVPALVKTELTADAAIGQAHLLVADDVSAWQNGDIVIAGKQDVVGQGVTTATVLSSVTGGTDITLTANLATNVRKAGGSVVNFTRGFGVYMTGTSSAVFGSINLSRPSNFFVKGCSFSDARLAETTKTYYYCVDDPAYRSEHVVDDNVFRTTGTTLSLIATHVIPIEGFSLKRNYCFRGNLIIALNGYSSSLIKTEYCTATDNVVMANGTTNINFNPSNQAKLKAWDNSFENSTRYGAQVAGLGLDLRRNKFWGILATPASDYYALAFGQTINPVAIEENTFDKCGLAVLFTANVTKSCVNTDSTFGTEAANTVDVKVIAGAIIDYTFRSHTGDLVFDLANMPDTISGSELRFTSFNNLENSDRTIVPEGVFRRCGYGLSDTTVWNGTAFAAAAAAGEFAMRMIPDLNASAVLSYGQTKTTGNIQGKLMTVSARVMIKSAAYYAGVHTSPTLRVVYDGGTEVSVVAADNTNAQLLQVSFTPTTTEGSITVYIEGATDAEEADAEFYLGELNIPLPEGVAIDTTRLGTWVDAMPLDSISTFETPASGWNAVASAYTTPGTMGAALGVINEGVQKASLLVPHDTDL